MNSCNRSPFLGSNATNSVHSFRTVNHRNNCCDNLSFNTNGINCNPNTNSNNPYKRLSSIGLTNNCFGLEELPKVSQSTSSAPYGPIVNNAREAMFATYPPYCNSTSSQSTTATQTLLSNITNSPSVATSSSVYMPLKMMAKDPLDSTMGCVETCNDCKPEMRPEMRPEMKVLIEYLENTRKRNEEFQSKLLNEIQQLKNALIDVKNATNDMPLKFSDVFTHSLASVQSRSSSFSISSEAELVDILDGIDLSKKCDEDIEAEAETQLASTQSTQIETENKEISNSNDIKKLTNDKFIFPYESTIDLNIWLKRD